MYILSWFQWYTILRLRWYHGIATLVIYISIYDFVIFCAYSVNMFLIDILLCWLKCNPNIIKVKLNAGEISRNVK